ADDLRLIRTLNADETYSLLKCPKKYTLAVKQISMPVQIQSKMTSSSLFDKFGWGGSKEDAAAVSAHNLAELLRKGRIEGLPIEAYVLHTKYCSYVTVGGFNSP